MFLEGGGNKISGGLEVSPEPLGPFLFLAPIVAARILPNRPLFFETLAQANFDKGGRGNGAIQSQKEDNITMRKKVWVPCFSSFHESFKGMLLMGLAIVFLT